MWFVCMHHIKAHPLPYDIDAFTLTLFLCAAAVRLRDGTTAENGRVEVYISKLDTQTDDRLAYNIVSIESNAHASQHQNK